jgi:hypothetical protein
VGLRDLSHNHPGHSLPQLFGGHRNDPGIYVDRSCGHLDYLIDSRTSKYRHRRDDDGAPCASQLDLAVDKGHGQQVGILPTSVNVSVRRR